MSKKPVTFITIPARLESKRLPKKLLLPINGKTLLQHTWEQCKRVKGVDAVVILTDSLEIKHIVESFGGLYYFSVEKFKCGTERCVSFAEQMEECDIILNVQGENIDVSPEGLQIAIEYLHGINYPLMTSLFYVDNVIDDPNLVKVVLNQNNYANWFSRSNIPYGAEKLNYHVGVYGLNRRLIDIYCNMNPIINSSEDLEQLRILENGYWIKMFETEKTTAIDSLDQYVKNT